MWKFFLLMFVAISFSCDVELNTSTKPVGNTFDETTATIVKEGTLMGVSHTASGKAAIYESNGKHVVVLDPYSSQNGPDLKVYLSKNVGASSYLNLGPLQSITGKQTYTVPGNPNIDEYTYVHIWCEKYSVEFARAEFK